MLLQLSHFPSLFPSTLHLPSHQHPPPLSSCPWVVHLSSLASPFPMLFLTFPVYFVPTIYASHSLYLSPHSLASSSLLITLPVISISVNLFLFYCLFSLFLFLGSVVDSCEFAVILLFIFLIIFFFLGKSL